MIVDASVVAALFLRDPGAEASERLVFAPRAALAGPDFLELEVASALTRRVRRNLLAEAEAIAAVASLPRLPIRLVAHGPLLRAAFALSLTLRHAIQDCLYLALAQAEGAGLATFDRRLATHAAALGITLWTPETA